MHVVLALGGNLGDRLAALQAGLDALAAVPGVRVRAVSPVYETDPVGGPEQPDYLNAVVLAEADLSPGELLAQAQRIETSLGRERGERWGPRTLDIDLVAVDELRMDTSALTLPHPRAQERAFVLAPWADLDPAAVLPGHGRVTALLAALPGRLRGGRAGMGIRRRDDLALEDAGGRGRTW